MKMNVYFFYFYVVILLANLLSGLFGFHISNLCTAGVMILALYLFGIKQEENRPITRRMRRPSNEITSDFSPTSEIKTTPEEIVIDFDLDLKKTNQ